MPFSKHMTTFAGKQVQEWKPGAPLGDVQNTAYRIGLSWEETDKDILIGDRMAEFLKMPDAQNVEALVVGQWGSLGEGIDVAPAVKVFADARDNLPRLKALFWGDVTQEECEISWIQQGDLSPLLAAFPQLEHFGVRGGSELNFVKLALPQLISLTIQTGGMSKEVMQQVASAELPNLEHLELWLGEEGYGASFDVEDLQPILSDNRFPKLRYLGLRNSEVADEIAANVATSEIIAQLEALDLSMGTLGDEGAAALLDSPAIGKLKKLVINHHYVSQPMVDKLKSAVPAVEADDQQEAEDEDDRYIAVGE